MPLVSSFCPNWTASLLCDASGKDGSRCASVSSSVQWGNSSCTGLVADVGQRPLPEPSVMRREPVQMDGPCSQRGTGLLTPRAADFPSLSPCSRNHNPLTQLPIAMPSWQPQLPAGWMPQLQPHQGPQRVTTQHPQWGACGCGSQPSQPCSPSPHLPCTHQTDQRSLGKLYHINEG